MLCLVASYVKRPYTHNITVLGDKHYAVERPRYFFVNHINLDKDEMLILPRAWDKEINPSPRRESSSWPPRYRLGALTTELRETLVELGHLSLFLFFFPFSFQTILQ